MSHSVSPCKLPSNRHPLLNLRSVGPATLQDLLLLGIDTPAKLAAADPRILYDKLCLRTGKNVDICQYDVFCCAVAQARDPNLPDEQKDWAWWSRRRKAAEARFFRLLSRAPADGSPDIIRRRFSAASVCRAVRQHF